MRMAAKTTDHTEMAAAPGRASAKSACRIALRPTVSRSRSRPIPGHPSGKLEKSFCRLRLLECLLEKATSMYRMPIFEGVGFLRESTPGRKRF